MTFAERAVGLATDAARQVAIDPAGATVTRVAAAVTVELPRARVFARVDPPGGLAAARRQVIVARILEQRRVPAARLVAPDRQPLVSTAGAVTLWHRLRIVAGSPSPESMGRLARHLHTACAGDLPAGTPALDPFEPLSGWLNRPCDVPPPPGADELWARLDLLREEWDESGLDDPLGTVLVHGDFHADNVVLTAAGPAMLDLEMAGRGPASWDLLAQRLAVERYGGPIEDYHRFCAGYGAELPDSPTVDLLRQAYELHLVCWAIGHRDTSPAMAAEAPIRLATFLGKSDETWTLL
jgi:hypothetical protein